MTDEEITELGLMSPAAWARRFAVEDATSTKAADGRRHGFMQWSDDARKRAGAATAAKHQKGAA